ncbi:crossover junction endodeoxyribonuclease RuvC [Candidatus Peregrinibacteria bacterium]|jgi:crossover junction endodeoxyribonuclease RuvC|nr:crossover junction endodeoxyribonuclease RuvC [Candidatus Peregrinibacteria bacterium]MBT4632145.1 crossover junction endodeoxyribonuclease RuvC [Candidatus Peregrinibacteria bacterium]MBT5517068.1 crossover junction endodeoxyribonuclease RuvC [Candidatus Peregrinibacteria bacterium]MBT5824063.1 crossover junction endodeoxyribonuclease RuvC [Candidatus Peregrinibacteria bacterium]
MRIIGIDPGLAIVGFAIIDLERGKKTLIDVGVIRTAPELSISERLLEIYKDMEELLKEYKPEHCSIEQIFFSNNVSTAINVAQARGTILLALEKSKIKIREYSPSAMKLAMTGDGTADKKAIQKMLCLELNLDEPPKPDDAADALSLALTLATELR